jgi:hypothetical protein
MKRSLAAASILCICVVLFSPLPAAAQKAKNRSPLDSVVHALFSVHQFGEVAISPDGQRLAWVESLTGKNGAPSPNSAIYVAELKNPAAPRRITAGNGTTSSFTSPISPAAQRAN